MSALPIIRSYNVAGATPSTPPLFGAIHGFAIRLAARIATEVRVRRDMRRLAAFDDFMLRDIGIARSDIEGAVRRGHDAVADGAACSYEIKPPPSLMA